MSISTRPLTPDDAQAVADLIGDFDAFHNGEGDRPSADDILDWWRRCDGGAVGVVDADGTILGAGSMRQRGDYYVADCFVDPPHCGRGVGTALLDWAEQATTGAGLPAVRASARSTDPSGKALLESRGYVYLRSFYRMVIDLHEPPEAPVWPEDFTLSLLAPGEERLLHEAFEDAFADHWGHEPRTFEQWMKHMGPLDGRICYVVRDESGAVVAAELCDVERFGAGLVAVLGVRAPWRRHGLGEALLRQAFHDLYERGQRRVGLGVDAENTTGATRLYERVGMRIALQDDAYEKLLHPRD